MAEQRYSEQIETLLANVRARLSDTDAATRVDAIRAFSEGIELIERCVVTEAHEAGLSWAHIGAAFDVTRQSAHKRFANIPVASAEVFEWLQSENHDDEPVPALAEAGRRAREMVKTQRGVHL